MELPNYRLPGLKTAQLLWKSRDFCSVPFTVIFLATIVIWFLQNFDLQLSLTSDAQNSILALLAGWIAPLFALLWLCGDWRISTALITGFMAKESVVSSLVVLFGSEAALAAALQPAAAAPLLGILPAVHPVWQQSPRSNGSCGKWAAIMVAEQCLIAWVCALLVRLYCIGHPVTLCIDLYQDQRWSFTLSQMGDVQLFAPCTAPKNWSFSPRPIMAWWTWSASAGLFPPAL